MTATISTPRRTAAQTRALILAALAEVAEPITVIELAEAAGLGKSTLSTHLPALEKDGKAVRTPGGRQGRRRLPDLWQAEATIAKVKVSTPEATPEAEPEQEDTAPAQGQDTAHGQHTPAPSTPVVPAPADTAGQDLNPVSGSERLAPGELKVMVLSLLDADPAAEFTATALSHMLAGRSIGAIQNNLARLAKEGRIQQTCDRPRRYRSAKQPA